ncbi:hypothetical protein, partial [Bacillus mycoides]|uniref:hypothetical protein n=1 Tax=Bacillus mycoides TaxID=1405 RepID=UPI003A810430
MRKNAEDTIEAAVRVRILGSKVEDGVRKFKVVILCRERHGFWITRDELVRVSISGGEIYAKDYLD